MSALLSLLVMLVVLAALPLPYAVGNGALRRAPVTVLLFALNFFIFMGTHVSLTRGLVEPIQAFNSYGLVPADVHARDLVTYAFLHVSGAHLLWNMVYLYLFGPAVEEKVGSLLYAALYLVGGAAAGLINSAIVMHFAGNSSAAYLPVVGASGAISAVLGLFTVFAANRPLKLFWSMGLLNGEKRHLLQIPAVCGIALWLAQTVYGASMSLINQDAGGVAYFTHLGGFVVGVVLGFCARQARTLFPQIGSAAVTNASPSIYSAGAASVKPDKNRGEIGTDNGLILLLGRAVDEDDLRRAEALYAKCQTMRLTLPPRLREKLEALRRTGGIALDGHSGEAMMPND